MRPPLSLEVAAARGVAALSRRLGAGGGTTIPGKLLAELDRGAIDRLAARLAAGTAVVSATNGKTTTTAMAAEILRPRHRLAHNGAGANLVSGVASALLSAGDADLGLFEVDEGALPELLRRLRPRALCLGNLFRDQLDRYGELELVAGRWRASVAALPAEARLVYNAVGAAALARALGAELDEIAAGLERFSAAFGRFERIAVGDKQLLLLLIKNPAGANEAVRTLVDGGAPQVVVVALNDQIADGRDVSWIWDVDFEPLLPSLETFVASGDRAAELALRFRYGGLDEGAIELEPDLGRALDRGLELTPDGGELVVLPTYTAMLGLQRLLASRGLAKPYWERSR